MKNKIFEILKNRRFWVGILLLVVIALVFPLAVIRLVTPIDNPLQKLNGICAFLANVKESSDWIGFWGNYFGGVSGGIITVMVFMWTIKDSEKTRKEEHRLQIIPVIDYEIMDMFCKKNLVTEKYKQTIKQSGSLERGDYVFELHLKWLIRNIGLGPAQRVTLEKMTRKIDEKNEVVNIYLNDIGTVTADRPKYLEYILRFMDDYDPAVGLSKVFTCEFSFEDIFRNKYSQEIDLKILYNFDDYGQNKDFSACKILNEQPAKLIAGCRETQ